MKKISLLLAVFAAALITLSSCSSGPQGVAKKWLTAFYHMDYAAAKSMSTPETVEQLDQQQQMSGDAKTAKDSAAKLTIDIKSEKKVSDSTAEVTYTVSNAPTQTKTLKLVKRNNKWLVQWSKLDDITEMLKNAGGNMPMPSSNDTSSYINATEDTSMPVAPPADGSAIDTSAGNMMK